MDTFLGKDLIPKAKEAGVKVLHKVGTVKHAIHAQKVGYDAVTIAGFEEGGFPHKDNVSTLVLVPRVVESVDIPVLAAGGMADGKSLAAALSLGADGIMMATRFLATEESGVHQNIYQTLLDKKENDTSLNLQSLLGDFGLQVRALRNDIICQVEEIEKQGGKLEELFPLISGQRAKKVWKEGNAEEAMLTIGQSVGRINDIPSVNTLVPRIIEEAKTTLSNSLNQLS